MHLIDRDLLTIYTVACCPSSMVITGSNTFLAFLPWRIDLDTVYIVYI